MPYAAGPPRSVHPSTIACFARPVASGQGAGLVRDAVPVHLHPSIQRRAAGAAPTGHPGRQRRYTRACVLDRSRRRHGETTGGRIQSMRAAGTHCTLVQAQAKARGPRAVHASRVSGDCWRPAGRPARPPQAAQRSTGGGYVRPRCALARAGKRQGRRRAAGRACFQCICMQTETAGGPPARCACARSSGSAETTVSGGSRGGPVQAVLA